MVKVSSRPPIVVVAAALTRADGRVLMQQRPAGKAHAGLWEFPGGKVEAGEQPAATLARELAEELGLRIDPADAEPLGFAADAAIVLLLYRLTRWRGSARPLAAAALRWAMPAELATWALPPLDVPLVARLAASA